jgi:hypothetical protein
VEIRQFVVDLPIRGWQRVEWRVACEAVFKAGFDVGPDGSAA